MSERAVRRSVTKIDPMFYIPEDVDELIYTDEEDDVLQVSEDEDPFGGDYEDVSEYEEYDDAGYDDAPETPQVLYIVPPQVIRMGDSGAEVVDVVFEVEEIPGATTYEFRVTKVD